jgi:hypothetical protein
VLTQKQTNKTNKKQIKTNKERTKHKGKDKD